MEKNLTTSNSEITRESMHQRTYRKKNPWAKHLGNIRARCGNSKFGKYKYRKNYLTMEDIKMLWFRDRAMDLDRPSIDRIDSDGDYTVDNCRFIEWGENAGRDKIGKVSPQAIPVIQKDLNGKELCIWTSATEAGRILGLDRTWIMRCCKSKKPYSGYLFEIKKEKSVEDCVEIDVEKLAETIEKFAKNQVTNYEIRTTDGEPEQRSFHSGSEIKTGLLAKAIANNKSILKWREE